MSWDSHQLDVQLGENEATEVGNSQRHLKAGTARINKVSAMKRGLAKIIANVRIS